MSSLNVLKSSGFGSTSRPDNWWLQPLVVFMGFSAFIAYSTWAAFQGAHYAFGNYLSPFYSPEIFGSSSHAIFGGRPEWWPGWLPFSPAFLILWAPGGFRFTCYYYRGAYYKAFWADPSNCAVAEPRDAYRGENSFPLIVQNLHRYFLYIALAFIALLAYDAYKAMFFLDELTRRESFGIGVGSIVLTLNVIFLGGYTFSCHSLRHIVGGCKDLLSGSPIRRSAYNCVSCLNKKHMNFAWISLFWVGFSDLYVRMCAMGIWTDWRLY